MLDALRTAAGTWVAKGLLALLVVSFAIWGITGRMISGLGSPSVIEVGRTSVSMKDYRLAYDRQVMILSQQFGQRLTREQAQALGIDQQVLGQLVSGALLDEQARQMGLGVSNQRIGELILTDPIFRGQSSPQRLDALLRELGMRRADLWHHRPPVAVRQQIGDAISDGMKAPDAFLQAYALYTGEDRTVDYVVVPRSAVEPIDEPAESALKTWFEEKKQTYAAPEYRKISYITLDPEALADPSSIGDDQVKKDYEAHLDRSEEQR